MIILFPANTHEVWEILDQRFKHRLEILLSVKQTNQTPSSMFNSDYDTVKKLVPKTNKEQPAKPFTEDDEANFVQKLEAELEKVAAFRKIKGEELERRIGILSKQYH